MAQRHALITGTLNAASGMQRSKIKDTIRYLSFFGIKNNKKKNNVVIIATCNPEMANK